ncbi:anti-sigma factor [Scopulibacillus cellulosilyticus]|uniref:Anti-sigma factor n=1 Tax=Scopulibacillus cellulosilyticus TaxID=2665665 RepID=A0ABW2PYY8_9BACL
MACSLEMKQLIDAVLDKEAATWEQEKLKAHIQACDNCKQHYHQLVKSVDLIKQLDQQHPPEHFTASVLSCIAAPNREYKYKRWMKRHPVMTAAAIFIFLMLGYVFSLWEQTPFQAMVKGKGRVEYHGHTVVVPKDEVIKGDLIVQNGKAKIEGKVKGNVVLINSHSLLASAGHVTGKIEKVNQIMEWAWYYIKDFFTRLFILKWLPV